MSRAGHRRQSSATTLEAGADSEPGPAAAHPDGISDAITRSLWALVLVTLVVVVAIRLGALDWYASDRLTGPDGTTERIPNTFASIDHPFHINKEQAVLNAIRDGDFPRWFSNHQAGYPAEFYPLGADLVVVVAWGLGLGLIPLEVIHKLVVIAVLFIPVAAYWAIARRDGWPASVAVTAAALHLFLPGAWFGGGPDELLRMGMWPNVFAAYLTLPLMLWSADYLRRGSLPGLVLATGAASLAIYTNPRAVVSVATILLAVGLVALSERLDRDASHDTRLPDRQPGRLMLARSHVSSLASRSILLTLVIVLMTAALTIPLRANQDLYEFSRFVEFSSPGKVWEYFSGALPIEITLIAVAGAVIAWRSGRFHTRVLALWMPLAAIVSIVAGGVLRDLPMLAQFEGPRMLPLVRLPALFLAAIAIHTFAGLVRDRWIPNVSHHVIDVAAVSVVAVFLLTPVSTLSDAERGLPSLETTDQPTFTAIARSAAAYEVASTPLDRPLIIGSPLSEHASFWIPALTGSNAFHAAWIWYWKTPDFADQTRIANIESALAIDFLRRHALTMVLVATNDSENLDLVRSIPHLALIDSGETGGYAIFRVQDPGPSVRGPVAVSSGEVTSLDLSRERLLAGIQTPQATEARVAIAVYPAWQATVNGQESPIRRSDDGYMLINIPAGDVELALTYTVARAVWLGRVLTLLGALLLAGTLVAPRVGRRRAIG